MGLGILGLSGKSPTRLRRVLDQGGGGVPSPLLAPPSPPTLQPLHLEPVPSPQHELKTPGSSGSPPYSLSSPSGLLGCSRAPWRPSAGAAHRLAPFPLTDPPRPLPPHHLPSRRDSHALFATLARAASTSPGHARPLPTMFLTQLRGCPLFWSQPHFCLAFAPTSVSLLEVGQGSPENWSMSPVLACGVPSSLPCCVHGRPLILPLGVFLPHTFPSPRRRLLGAWGSGLAYPQRHLQLNPVGA